MAHSIDVMELYSKGNAKNWNNWLRRCYKARDINQLLAVKKELQIGMDNLTKQKLQNRDIANTFLRWCRSIDLTIKKIVRAKDPNPCDNPLIAKSNLEHIDHKKKRDLALEKFLFKESF